MQSAALQMVIWAVFAKCSPAGRNHLLLHVTAALAVRETESNGHWGWQYARKVTEGVQPSFHHTHHSLIPEKHKSTGQGFNPREVKEGKRASSSLQQAGLKVAREAFEDCC